MATRPDIVALEGARKSLDHGEYFFDLAQFIPEAGGQSVCDAECYRLFDTFLDMDTKQAA